MCVHGVIFSTFLFANFHNKISERKVLPSEIRLLMSMALSFLQTIVWGEKKNLRALPLALENPR